MNQNAEIGQIGLPYRTLSIFVSTETLLLDLCYSCGTVLRFFVKESKRNWKS